MQVFDLITPQPVSVEQLRTTGPLFPPVFVGLKASIRSGRWRVIGHLPVQNFVFPTFRMTNGHGPGTYEDWSLWDGEREISLGRLPPKLRHLEVLRVWGDELLEERIMTGKNHHALLQ